jgi:hypothetical protein
MDVQINPFTPSFGRVPPILAGRRALVSELEHALVSSPNDPILVSLFSGPRGVGKTVLLSYLANKAEATGWISVNVTARPGMLEDIFERTVDAANEFVERSSKARITSVTVPALFSATWEYRDTASGNWRTRMNRVLDVLDQNSVGLLFTIDEVDATLDELVDFSATFQHFIREGRKVALFMAGLPINVSALLSDKSVSFLRRASQHALGRIEDDDIAHAFRETVEEFGKTITDDALELAVSEIGGFAYMMQLVGFRTWAQAEASTSIDVSHVRAATGLAKQDFINGVVKKTLQELSDGDIAFLEAMLPDEGEPSLVSDVAERMGKTANYARVYRTRLAEQGVIAATRRNTVEFDMPLLREYLSEE